MHGHPDSTAVGKIDGFQAGRIMGARPRGHPASNRARECEMRLNGAGYEDIARVGDGINITLQATRTANEDGRVRGAFYTLRETQLPRIVPS